MCWNAQVSLETFIFGLAAIGYGAYLGISLPVLLFCLTIVTMQLVEYVVWTYYDDDDVNTKASMAAAALLWMQPIASIMLLPHPFAILTAYIALSVVGYITMAKKDFSMKRAANGHLAWNFLHKDTRSYLELAVYFLFLLGPILMTHNTELLVIALATLGLSVYSYWRSNTWGSMWCWLVNGIVFLLVGSSAIGKFSSR